MARRNFAVGAAAVALAAMAAASLFGATLTCHYDKIKLKYNYVHPDGWDGVTKAVTVRVSNAAEAGGVVAGAEVSAEVVGIPTLAGWKENAVTDQQGIADLGRLPRGADLLVSASKPGFNNLTGHRSTLADDGTDERIEVVLSPALVAPAFRVVLEWENGTDRAADLDLHDQLYNSSGHKAFHLYYAEYYKPGSRDDKPPFGTDYTKEGVVFSLDRDSIYRDHNLETITVHVPQPGTVHHFYVHHYPKKPNVTETADATILNSGAQITLYSGDAVPQVLRVEDAAVDATPKKGWYWHVFCVHDSPSRGGAGVKTINRVKTTDWMSCP